MRRIGSYSHASQEHENYIIIPMIDARRDEVYTATFLDDGSVLNKTRAKIIDAAFFIHYSNYKKVHLIGDGCLKFKGRFKQSNLILHEDLLCSSSSMTNCIYEKFQKKEHENTAYFEPFYLKDFKPF